MLKLKLSAGGVLRKYLYGDAQSRLQNVDHLYTCVLKKKKNTRSLYLKYEPTHLYTIFTEMMTHYYHFHQQNSPSSYHHRNKGSLIYLKQFQNHPIGIPKLMKMHLKNFEHPRTPYFRENPPPPGLVLMTSKPIFYRVGLLRSPKLSPCPCMYSACASLTYSYT